MRLASVLALSCSCLRLLPAPSPMRAVAALRPGGARCLVVLLPGAGDSAEDFARHGFVEALSRAASVDVVSADATLGYYVKNTFLERFGADVLTPARARGYAETWLVGPSMGGYGALAYASQHPGEVQGVLALAPWLGDRDLEAEIRAAGGLAKWPPPPPETPNADNYQRQLWRWLKARTLGGAPGPTLYVGWGRADRLGSADLLLAEALPPDHVYATAGGHDWEPWRALLGTFLATSDFARRCAP